MPFENEKGLVTSAPNSNKNSEENRTHMTVSQSIITGGVSGATEVMIDHPLWSLKTRVQLKEPFTLNPRVLYRGVLPNAASMVPITAVQVGLNQFFQQTFFKDVDLSFAQRFMTSLAAGYTSAIVSGPTEMVMTHQQKANDELKKTAGKNMKKVSFFMTAEKLVQQKRGYRSLLAGIATTGIRDGLFTASYTTVRPWVKNQILPYCQNDVSASLFSGIMAGLGGTVVSQAFDTLKADQQSVGDQKSLNLYKAAKERCQSTKGIYSLFDGMFWRGLRVISAVTIIGAVNEKMEQRFNPPVKKM